MRQIRIISQETAQGKERSSLGATIRYNLHLFYNSLFLKELTSQLSLKKELKTPQLILSITSTQGIAMRIRKING